jgi:TolA protein
MSTRSGGEGGLVWAIGASGLAHGAALALLALTPSRFEGMGTPPESYSVELIDPSAVSGTHFPGAPNVQPAVLPKILPEEPSGPAEPKAEVVTEPLAPAKAEPKAEVAKEPPVRAKAVEPAPEPPPPVKAPEAAKVAEPEKLPEPKEAAEAVEAKKPETSTAPAIDVPAKPDEKKKSVPPEEPARKAKKAVPEKKEKKKVEAKEEQPARTAAVAKKSEDKPTERDEQIAAAIQRRAEEAGGDSDSKKADKGDVDRRIAAAVQRRAMDAARAAAGIGSSDSSVASVGPGAGVGGVVRGIEYLMYRNRMESRIKAAWAWAGADRSLRAVVRFNVTAEGKIVNVTTVQSSGDTSYDASVERAIRAADPLGPPPEQYRDEFSTVELEFRAEDARG